MILILFDDVIFDVDADIHLNSRTFTLPAELEKVLDLSTGRLTVVRDNLEASLRLA